MRFLKETTLYYLYQQLKVYKNIFTDILIEKLKNYCLLFLSQGSQVGPSRYKEAYENLSDRQGKPFIDEVSNFHDIQRTHKGCNFLGT